MTGSDKQEMKPTLTLPAPVNVSLAGDKVTKAMFSGMNSMLNDCKKHLEAEGYTVKLGGK
ncbi:hypothetical protein fHeYen801_098 [Yersinia phage fHe-Yen8-01]|nr:hypothetical protein fHeYen801_098 [Yersinia phage fHe-Yen8-01]